MIATQAKREIEIENAIDTIKMKLSKTDEVEAHIVKILTENYNYPLESHVREAISNHWDSHVENGTPDNPIFVKLYSDGTGNYILETSDTGLGLTEEEFDKYYMQVGESSKRGKANLIGGKGCGAKSILSFSDSYTVICRKNGEENTFLVFKGEDFPERTLLSKTTTEQPNGVIVKVNINRWDYSRVKNAIKEQLCYFPTCYFEIEGEPDFNNFKIYENDLFRWSSLYPDNELHIAFGNCRYPIDWKLLKIKEINVPVAIKIPIDSGIDVQFNREALTYNKFCKEYILDKIKAVSDWFVDKYNETNTEFTDIDQIYYYFYHSSRYVKLGENDIQINSLFSYTDKKCNIPTFKGIEKMKLETIYNSYNQFLKPYVSIGEINNGRYTGRNPKTNILSLVRQNKKLILCSSVPNKKMLEFIKDTIGDCIFINKRHEYKLGQYWSEGGSWRNTDYSYAKFLKLYQYPKSEWRQVINEWNSLEKLYEDKFIDINSIQITKEWEESRKKQRVAVKGTRNQRLEGEINFKFAEQMEKYSNNWNCKFVSKILSLKNFHKYKGIVVYALDEQRQKLDDLWEISKRNSKHLEIAIVGQRDYEKLKTIKLHNLMSIDEFESSFNKPIAKYVTSFKISQFVEKYRDIFKVRGTIRKINKDFAQSLDDLYNYQNDHKNPDNSLMQSLVAFCEKNNYYDYPIYLTLQEVSKNIDKLDFIDLFMDKNRYSYSYSIPEKAIPIIQELLKARKFKMDWEHYVKKEEVGQNVQEDVQVKEEELELQEQD